MKGYGSLDNGSSDIPILSKLIDETCDKDTGPKKVTQIM